MNRSGAFTLYPILILVGFFAILVFVPKIFQKNSYQMPTSEQAKAGQALATDMAFPVFPSGSMKLANYFGGKRKAILVNFWATWCPPCLEELPSLEQLHRQLLAKNDPSFPVLVTISVDERFKEITDLFKTLDVKPTFPILHDPDGIYAQKLGTTKFPETFLIDAQGNILYKWIGPQNWLSAEVLQRLVQFKG